MTLNGIIKIASEGYPDGLVAECWDAEKQKVVLGVVGDTLAEFIVLELASTFDPDASDKEQLLQAGNCISRAQAELDSVCTAFAERIRELSYSGDFLAPLKYLN